MSHLEPVSNVGSQSFLNRWSGVGTMVVAAAIGSATFAIADSAYAVGLESPAYAPSLWSTNPPDGTGVQFNIPSNQITLGAPTRGASINAAASGTLSFRWNTSLDEIDGAGAASITIGSDKTTLNPSSGVSSVTSESFQVLQGELISFDLASGNDTGAFTITNFDAPIPTPAMLPGLVGMGIAFWRKKNQQAENEGGQEAPESI